MDTSWIITAGGSITISSTGSLIKNSPQRDLWVSGGAFTNNGNFEMRYLWTQAGSFSNTGTVTLNSFLNNINFTNDGTFQNIDSIYSTASIINNGIFQNIDSITTGGSFTNIGMCTFNQFTNTGNFTNNGSLTFTDFTNRGVFTNAHIVSCLNSIWNVEEFNNQHTGNINIATSILNADSIQHNSTLTNDGRIVINDSYYNADTVKGSFSGSFQVADSSMNWGWMSGSFDFCDLTPPASGPPFIDFNIGYTDPLITWCTYTGVNKVINERFKFYPNPVAQKLYFEKGDLINFCVEIYDSNGRLIRKIANETELDVTSFKEGIYSVRIVSEEMNCYTKISILK